MNPLSMYWKISSAVIFLGAVRCKIGTGNLHCADTPELMVGFKTVVKSIFLTQVRVLTDLSEIRKVLLSIIYRLILFSVIISLYRSQSQAWQAIRILLEISH